MRHSRGEMYTAHGRPCICVPVGLSLAAFTRYCTDLDVTWRNGLGCPLVAYCWAYLQSVRGFRCYDNEHSAEREMSTSACTLCMPGLHLQGDFVAVSRFHRMTESVLGLYLSSLPLDNTSTVVHISGVQPSYFRRNAGKVVYDGAIVSYTSMQSIYNQQL